MTRRTNRARQQEALWGYVFAAPMVIGVGVFCFWPIGRSIYLSLTKTGYFGGQSWTGLSNYRTLFADPLFWTSLLNSVIYSAIVLIGIPISIFIAALLNQRGMRLTGLYRSLYFLPVVTMPAATALIWRAIYNGDSGLLNAVLVLVGIHGPHWLVDAHTALVAIAVVSIWSGLGTHIILFLAGLQEISASYYEAAEVDGASRWQQLRHITMPLLTPTTFFVAVITVINSVQAFDLIYVMLGSNNPVAPQVQTIVYYFFQKAFIGHDAGMGSAVATVLLVVLLALTALQFRMQRRWVQYGG